MEGSLSCRSSAGPDLATTDDNTSTKISQVSESARSRFKTSIEVARVLPTPLERKGMTYRFDEI